MKKILFILSAALIFAACSKQAKQTEQQNTGKPPTRAEMVKTITDKEKAEPGTMVMPKKGRSNRTTAGFINGGLSNISGDASVGHGPEYDTIAATVFHWGMARLNNLEALWHSVFVAHTDINAPYPGRSTYLDMVNYNAYLPNPIAPAQYQTLWPHQGLAVSYFIGVSSDGGWNYAGKTIPNN